MKPFQGTDDERIKLLKEIWEDQSKLLQGIQLLMKEGLEKNKVIEKMVEGNMWLRLYMEIENIKPDIKVAIGTKPIPPKENN